VPFPESTPKLLPDTRDLPTDRTVEDGLSEPLLAVISQIFDANGESDAIETALGSAVEALGAEFGALIRDGRTASAVGLAGAGPMARALGDAAERGLAHSSLPELGAVDLASARLEPEGTSVLLVGRRHRAPFGHRESELLEGIARVMGLKLRVARATEQERGLRRLGQHETRQRKRVERELARQALHDRLTGLPNRSLLRERANHALERARHGVGCVAALFVDLDHFKLTNDSLDHRHGDKLLLLISGRLTTILALEENDRRSLTLARAGGDEFIVLCEDLGTERDAVTVAQQIQEALRAPFFVDGQEVLLTASIGIAFAEGTEVDADALLRDADVALSRAKERGRDRYVIFDEQMRVRLLDRVALETDLRAGLDRDELRLLYQPVVTASDGSLAAVEALVRWQHPTRGLLAPGEFIAVAEESDLIVALGSWVIEEACEQIRRWREAHPAKLGVRVSVNVSARQLSPALVETVAQALERCGVHPSGLALEITESLLIEHTESAREVLAALEALGVAIVLDDFGTGYSSLGYLNEFPLGQLKLDRTFTSELARDPRSAKIVAATIDMARALGMTVVAEGVETEDQLEVLQRLGCDYAQGFLFARPETGDAIFARIHAAYEHDNEIITGHAGSAKFASDSTALRGRSPEDPHRRQQVAIGRLAGWLFLVGSTLAIPSDLVMGTPSPLAVFLLTTMGVLTGLICFAVPWHRVSARWLNGLAVVATVEITVSVIAIGRHGTVLQPIYLLIATATAYAFTDRRVIAGHVALIGVAMTVTLTYRSGTSAAAVPLTIVMILVLIVMSAVIAYLRELLEGSAAELRELAARDPLTDVGNYRLLHERLDYELARHEREGAQLAVLLIDLDRFKQVNERLGHAAGDDVLRRVALTLRDAVRQQDTVARQGGDEFAVLAPSTDAEGAAMLAARVRDRLSRVQFAGDSVGATIGWSVYPDDGATANELLARADESLMTGKLRPHHGRSSPAVGHAA
jgi:diguanylate cyclase (GGDEF)-like protein